MSIIQRASRWVRGPTDSCAVGGRVNLRHLPALGVLSGKAAGMVADGGHSGAAAKMPGGVQRYRTDTDGVCCAVCPRSPERLTHLRLLAGSDGQEPARRARARNRMQFSMSFSGFVHLCIGIHPTNPHINIIMWSTPLTACFCVDFFDIAGVLQSLQPGVGSHYLN